MDLWSWPILYCNYDTPCIATHGSQAKTLQDQEPISWLCLPPKSALVITILCLQGNCNFLHWSLHVPKQKIAANLWNTIDVSLKFCAFYKRWFFAYSQQSHDIWLRLHLTQVQMNSSHYYNYAKKTESNWKNFLHTLTKKLFERTPKKHYPILTNWKIFIKLKVNT